MRRIDGERGEDREYVVEEIILEPRLLGLRHLGAVDQHDVLVNQLLAQFAPARLLISPQRRYRLGDSRKLLGRGQAVRAFGRDAGPHLAFEAGDPDHEEFIEVIG